MTRPVHLRRSRESRPDLRRQVRQVRLELLFVRLHLLHDLLVHLRSRIVLRRFFLRRVRLRRFCGGRWWQGPPRQHPRQFRRVVRPCCQHLCSLDQVIFPGLVECICLAVVRLRIFRNVLHAPESRHARLVKRQAVHSRLPRHCWFQQFQVVQRRHHLVDNLPRLVVIVQTQRQHPPRSAVVNQRRRYLVQFVLVRLHVFL